MNLKRIRILGAYILAIGLLQIYFYLVMLMSTEKEGWLFYFDPRIGIFFLESSIRGTEEIAPGIFRWFSAVWISTIGLILVSGRPIVKTYIVSELALMLPSVIFFVLIIWANLTPAHGFSVSELIFPALVTIVFSIVPLRLAFWSRSKSKMGIESLNLNRS